MLITLDNIRQVLLAVKTKLDGITSRVGTVESSVSSIQSNMVTSVNGQKGAVTNIATTSEVDALETRIDNIVAPSGDPSLTEVSDARVGADSAVYSTLKGRIDGEVNELNERLSDAGIDLLFGATWQDGALKVYTGEVIEGNTYKYCIVNTPSDYGKIKIYTKSSSPQSQIVFFDENDDYISDTFSIVNPAVFEEKTVDIPSNTSKIGIVCRTDELSKCKCVYSVGDSISELASGKQDTLTFDDIPVANSNNPVKSGGIKSYVDSLSGGVEQSASDDTVLITDGKADSLLTAWKVSIEPVYSGSGTPSPDNVRDITGFTSINLYHSGEDTTDPTTIAETLYNTPIYGGEADLINGTLKSSIGLFVFDGSENWQDYPSQKGFTLSTTMKAGSDYRDAICNWMPTVVQLNAYGIRVGIANNFIYCVHVTDTIQGISSLADWKAYLSTHNLKVTYPLATDITATIEKHNIELLSGVNNIWSNGGSTFVTYIQNILNYVNKWKGKKYACIGDSITWGFGPKNTSYYRQQIPSYAQIGADNLEMEITNQAIAGCTFAVLAGHETDLYPIATRWQNLPDDADLITVTGGTNDVRLGVPLGTMADRGTDTYYGAWHTVLGGLYKKYFIDQGSAVGATKKIVVITPIKLIGTPAQTSGGNGTLYNWDTWINAIKEVAAYYSLPVLDFYNLSGINPQLNGSVYDSDTGYTGYYNQYITDGVHPTIEGQKIMGDVFTGFIKSLK